MKSASPADSVRSAPATTFAPAPGVSSTMYSSGWSARASTEPGATSDTATTKFAPRVILVRVPSASVSCGGWR